MSVLHRIFWFLRKCGKHTKVHRTSLKSSTDRVEDDGKNDGILPAEIFVRGRQQKCTADGAQGHAGVDQTVLACIEAKVKGKVQVRA